ncbi:MAG: thioesterase family protein [Pseudomonadales bacterium]|jgi:acyl-CoA thioester hydrolase
MWDAPLIAPDQAVDAAWIDYNGHLNMAYYNVLFDRGVDHVYDLIGIGEQYVHEQQGSCFTMEVHVNYLSEVTLGDPVSVSFQLIDFDAKRLHFFQEMTNRTTGETAATSEQLALHVDMASRRSAPFPEPALEQIAALHAAHQNLPRPELLGRVISIKRR